MHPSSRVRGAKSRRLHGRRIVLGVSGSIAAVESVHLAHELIRHGAEVIPVMTQAAATIITPLALEFATGRPPVLHLSGAGEHVAWMDGPEKADLLLVAPATANTLAKIALGIDDTALTSFATVALGSGTPLVVAPAMHEVMNRNPAIEARLKELQAMGVHVVPPRIEEGKAKLATPEEIVDAVIHRLAEGPWAGKKVLVIGGSTAEPVDPIRVLTNRSTGRMAVELARAAFHEGADVTLWNAWGSVPLPAWARIRRFETVKQALALATRKNLAPFDAVFLPAALGDFAPRAAKHKIPTDGPAPTIALEPLPKVIKTVRAHAPKATLVMFKAESDGAKLLERARQRKEEYGADLVVANLDDAFGATATRVQLVDGKAKPTTVQGPKSELARAILAAAAKHLRG